MFMTDGRGHVEIYRQKPVCADMKLGPHFGARRCVRRCWSRGVQEEKRGEQLERDKCSVLYCVVTNLKHFKQLTPWC